MAKKQGVWGIDIGQCALKALFCELEDGEVVAKAFDYIEYPKILSQPEANPEELIGEAMDQFMAQNEVKGHLISMSVPGQAGLARFFKPPPVDSKKIPEIVRYEAKQQIPFDLEEVIWDYQKMSGGQEVDGFTLDAEVGLFAMKRDQVYRAIEPLTQVSLEPNIIQLAPLSIYNFVAADLLRDGPSEDEYDPDHPPESLVILSMGTESSDLVVTNGFRVWQRSIPIGGNHFTKQLTKELKLTFAKAEHLKRNARKAEDPRRVFQAMRPVFNDLVTEVQRSIGFFQNMDRQAKLRGVVLLGNTVKLPGLQHYLSKNLGYDVIEFRKFHTLGGSEITSAPAFKENVFGFGVAYGLCLQGLKQARLNTNLVPREIIVNRLIREKKPWAVAGIASLMLACSLAFVAPSNKAYDVNEERDFNGLTWVSAKSKVQSAKGTSDSHKSTDSGLVGDMKKLTALGEEVVGSADRRLLWLEFMRTLNASLPRTPGITPGTVADHKNFPYDQRRELFLDYVESEHYDDLSKWYTASVKVKYLDAQGRPDSVTEAERRAAQEEEERAAAANEGDSGDGAGDGSTDGEAASADGATPPADGAAADGDAAAAPAPAAPAADATALKEDDSGPTGAGWVIEVKGHHFFNKDQQTSGIAYLNMSLLNALQTGTIELPIEPGKPETRTFTFKELGIGYAIVRTDNQIDFKNKLPNPDYEPKKQGEAGDSGDGGPPGGGYPGPGAGDGLEGGGPPGGAGDFSSSGGSSSGGSAPPGGGEEGGDFNSGYGSGPGGPGGPGGGSGGLGAGITSDPDSYIVVPRYDFVVQFVWQEKLLSARLEEARKKDAEKAAAQAAADDGAGDQSATQPEGDQ